MGSALYSAWLIFTNYLYGLLAVKLNNWENYRTVTAYEDALVLKTSCFYFVNSLNAFDQRTFSLQTCNGFTTNKGRVSNNVYCRIQET